MSKKNFKVATTENGKTPKQNTSKTDHIFATTKITKDKTPTGKVKTMKDKEALRKEREEQYKNFRINALKRRAKRMGLSDEQTEVKIKELISQIESPNQYHVLIWYNPADFDMMKQALKNEDLVVDMMTTTYLFITADADTLATLRSIAPSSAKIYPYVKRKPPILPSSEPSGRGKKTRTKAEKKNLAAAAKKARKAAKNLKTKEARRQQAIMKRKEEHNKAARKAKKAKMLFDKRCKKASTKANKKQSGTTVSLVNKKPSESLKKASKSVKQAA